MEKICCVDMPIDNKINHTVEFLKLIAEENRLKILCILLSGELCVCDIWQYLNIPQNLTSHHLKALKDFGLLNARKEGLNVYYSINHENLSHAKKLLDDFLAGKRRAC